jgi:hypothetical protein
VQVVFRLVDGRVKKVGSGGRRSVVFSTFLMSLFKVWFQADYGKCLSVVTVLV